MYGTLHHAESSGPWNHTQNEAEVPYPPNSIPPIRKPRERLPHLNQSLEDVKPESTSGNSLPAVNTPNDALQDSRLPKHVLFYRNGDRYFRGKKVRVTPQRYLSLDGLLNDLTKTVSLPYGVRRLYTPVGGTRVRQMGEIKEGEAYVCASFEKFKKLKYGSSKEPNWRTSRKSVPNENFLYDHSTGNQYPAGGKYASSYGTRAGRPDPVTLNRSKESQTAPPSDLKSLPPKYLNSLNNRPKLIKIVKASRKPYQSVSLLLNKRTILSYEQLLHDISEAFSLPNHRNYKISRLYNTKGDEIKGVADFFRDQDGVIIGATLKYHVTGEELVEILEDVLPGSLLSRKLRIKQMRDTGVKGDSGIENDDDLSSQENGNAALILRTFPKGKRRKADGAAKVRKTAGGHAGGDSLGEPAKESRVEQACNKENGDSLANISAVEESTKIGKVEQILSENTGARKLQKDKGKAGRKKIPPHKQDKPLANSDRVIKNETQTTQKTLTEHGEAKAEHDRKEGSRSGNISCTETSEASVLADRNVKTDSKEIKQEIEDRMEEGKRGEEMMDGQGTEVNYSETQEEEERLARLLSRVAQEEAAKEILQNLEEMDDAETEEASRDEGRNDGSSHEEASPQNGREGASQETSQENVSDEDADSRQLQETISSASEDKQQDDLGKVEEIDTDVRVIEGDEKNHTQSDELVPTNDSASGEKRPHDVNNGKLIDVECSEEEKVEGRDKREHSQSDDELVLSGESQNIREFDGSKKRAISESDDGGLVEGLENDTPPPKDFEFSGRSGQFVIHPREICTEKDVLERFQLGDKVGDGNFADVFAGMRRHSGEEYAVKKVDKSKLGGKESMIENEIAILKKIDHPNIVKLHEEYETKDFIYLIMDYVRGGDLFDAIIDSVKFTEADASVMVQDLASALNYLHEMNVVHRDMKPENLLVHLTEKNKMQLKLADFGLAMEVIKPVYTVCGTPTYVAPEILAETGYGLPIDLWALGVIMYILLCGFPPFRSPDKNQDKLFKLIQSGKFEYISPYWNSISKEAKDLIDHLLVVDQTKRFTAHQVLTHPWVAGGERSKSTTNLQREVSMNLEKNFSRPPSSKR